MFSESKAGPSYQQVPQPELPSSDMRHSDDTPEHYSLPRPGRRNTVFLSLIWLGSVFFASLSGGVLTKYYIGNSQCQESDLAWGPAEGLSRRHWHRFDGSINVTNVFKGQPRAELDEAWDRFTDSKWIDGTSVVLTATEQEMKDSGNAEHPATVADLGEENGGGAMATLEMFHQLHCLNLLRKWTHVDYYKTRDHAWFFDRSDSLRRHTDHCIDILRQVLMCNGDMGLVMFHWVKGVGPAPYPDFSTMHRCRDPVNILETAEKHAAPVVRPLTKTSVAHELPTFP